MDYSLDHKRLRSMAAIIGALSLSLSSAAFAEENTPLASEDSAAGDAALQSSSSASPQLPVEESVFDGDFITMGVGGVFGPSYQGSDDYVLFPGPAVIGRVKGVNFVTRGTGLSADLWTNNDGRDFDLLLGPVVRVRFDRVSLGSINDPVVEALGDVDLPVELGISAGAQWSKVLTPVDNLTAALEVKWDVAGGHNGMVISPYVTYFTALSRGIAVTATISGEIVDDDFSSTYYGVDADGSAASGLPIFNAQGGVKNLGMFLLAGFDLDGNLANGGFAIFGAAGYDRLFEDARRSPLVNIRGDADQFVGAVGIGYTF